jgi:diguanylate cyclase (GGDEF)-like protein
VQQGTGSLEQAVTSLDEAAQLLGDGGLRMHRVVRGNLALTLVKWAREQRDLGGDAAVWRASAERAVSLMQRQTAGLAHPGQTEDRTMRYAFGCMAAALVVLDELPAAQGLLLQLRPLYGAARDARAVLFVDTELTRAALQAGRPGEAVARARQGIEAAEAAGHFGEIDELYRLLADALEAVGEHREALQAHRSFHRLHKQAVLEKALHRTRALAVALETERARRESRLDPLTGLPNRRAFDEALPRALAAATSDAPLALALLDLDHFKQVNDLHGHAHGDAALQLLAELLQTHPRPGDLAARLGGDEFVLLVPGDAPAAATLCTRLREALRQASLLRWPGRPPLTLSVGIAATAAPCAAQDLLSRADRALYAVKAGGRDAQAVG